MSREAMADFGALVGIWVRCESKPRGRGVPHCSQRFSWSCNRVACKKKWMKTVRILGVEGRPSIRRHEEEDDFYPGLARCNNGL